MRLFHRKPEPVEPVYTLQDICECLAGITIELKGTRLEVKALRIDLDAYAREVAQVAKYLAELERERNAATAGSQWQKLEDGTEKRDPESAEERLIRLRAEYQQMKDRSSNGK